MSSASSDDSHANNSTEQSTYFSDTMCMVTYKVYAICHLQTNIWGCMHISYNPDNLASWEKLTVKR